MTITLAVDAMGGDHGPKVTIPASINALSKYDQLHIILVGDKELIQKELQKINTPIHAYRFNMQVKWLKWMSPRKAL